MEERVSLDMVGTPMLKFFVFVALVCSTAVAEEFSIQVAGPVAAQTYQMKSSAFVFRALGCEAPAKLEVTATAEGLVQGQRRSMPLRVSPAQTAGVFGSFASGPMKASGL